MKVLPINDEFRTEEEIRKGLMFREEYPSNACAVFYLPTPRRAHFWGKGTLLPLDIIYVDKNGKVESVKEIDALDLTPVSSDGTCAIAIECPRGAADGISVGDKLEIETGYARFL